MSYAVKNYIEQQQALHTQRTERLVKEQEEEEGIKAALPHIWEQLKASVEDDCQASPKTLTYRYLPNERTLQVRSAWHWHDLYIAFNPERGTVTAECRTNYLTSPEEVLWRREYVGEFFKGAVYLTLSESLKSDSPRLQTPENVGDELLIATLARNESSHVLTDTSGTSCT
jgi:hypothetical protein